MQTSCTILSPTGVKGFRNSVSRKRKASTTTMATKTKKAASTEPTPESLANGFPVAFNNSVKHPWFAGSKERRYASEAPTLLDYKATEAELLARASRTAKIPIEEMIRKGALQYARTALAKASMNDSSLIDQGRIAKAYKELERKGVDNITPSKLKAQCVPTSNYRSCRDWLIAHRKTWTSNGKLQGYGVDE